MQRLGLADRREADEAGLALLARAIERRHHVAEHLVDAHRHAVGARRDHVVQLEHVDMVALQPRCRLASSEAAIAAPMSGAAAGTRTLVERMMSGFRHAEHAADILLRRAVPVGRRGVEMIDAGLERARDRALLVGRRALGHQPADRAAAEGEHRDTSRPVRPSLRFSMKWLPVERCELAGCASCGPEPRGTWCAETRERRMRLTDFKVLTFDCYGTLIDWETGMVEALKPLTDQGEDAAHPQRRSWRRMRAMSRRSKCRRRRSSTASCWRSSTSASPRNGAIAAIWDECQRYGRSVRDWPAFPDTAGRARSISSSTTSS